VNVVKIKDLKSRMSGFDLVAKVVEKSQPTLKGGKRYSVAVIEDETGRVTLNLWRDQVDQVEVGDIIRIPRAFTQRQYGILRVSTWSDIEVIHREKKS
jgi:ssDNA-binding replication factor A large subunit